MLQPRPEIENLKDPDQRNLMRDVYENSLGKAIVLDSAPTTTGEELKEGQIGYHSNKLYITINGTTYSANLTAV